YEWRSLPLYAEKFEAKWHKVYQNTWRGKTPGFIRGDAPCAARVSLAELLSKCNVSKCFFILVGFHPVSETEGLHPTLKIK
ncbi:MAG: hypothetical protein ACK4ZI_20015, partial [Microcystis sp.]|uniref:hypothetical protein n=1 Tax=Microcystis sp. TaxID=1127 RepID=UPI00391B4684